LLIICLEEGVHEPVALRGESRVGAAEADLFRDGGLQELGTFLKRVEQTWRKRVSAADSDGDEEEFMSCVM